MSNKKALITGISGQDGSYLAELLLEKGYDVYGIVRRHSAPETQTSRIQHILKSLNTVYGDLLDVSSLIHAIEKIQPDEIYNLAAQSHVAISFDLPNYTVESIVLGTLNILETIRMVNKDIRMYQASSSEIFGNNIDDDGFQRETTPMSPTSPYGCAKLCAYHLCKNYRNAYNLFISNGLLFNHESNRRGSNFVSKKIVQGAVDIKKGKKDKLELGNLDSCRDWGHSKDYVNVMWEILQLSSPDDFVCATGVAHSVREMCEYVFTRLGLDYEDHVVVNQKFVRPEELHYLKGDPSKLIKTLNWKPTHTFESMLDEMIQHEQS